MALTIIRIALSSPPGERREMAIAHTKTGYRQICELVRRVPRQRNERVKLRSQLERNRAALDVMNAAIPDQLQMSAQIPSKGRRVRQGRSGPSKAQQSSVG